MFRNLFFFFFFIDKIFIKPNGHEKRELVQKDKKKPNNRDLDKLKSGLIGSGIWNNASSREAIPKHVRYTCPPQDETASSAAKELLRRSSFSSTSMSLRSPSYHKLQSLVPIQAVSPRSPSFLKLQSSSIVRLERTHVSGVSLTRRSLSVH